MKTKNKSLFLLKIGIVFMLLMTLFMCRDVKAENATYQNYGSTQTYTLPQGTNRKLSATIQYGISFGYYTWHGWGDAQIKVFDRKGNQVWATGVYHKSESGLNDCGAYYSYASLSDIAIPDSAMTLQIIGGRGTGVEDIGGGKHRDVQSVSGGASVTLTYTPFTPTKELIIKGTLKTVGTKGALSIDESTPFTIVLKDTSDSWYEVTSASNNSVNVASSSMDITGSFTTGDIENTENAIILNGTLKTDQTVTGESPLTKSSTFSLKIDKTTGKFDFQGGTTKFIAETEDSVGHLTTMTVTSVNDKYGNIIEFQSPRISSNLTV